MSHLLSRRFSRGIHHLLACLSIALLAASTAHGAVAITATKSDNTAAATKKNPGDTIDYTVVITNSGNVDVTGVTYNDPTLDPAPDETTLVAGSLNVSPLAIDDVFTGVRNTLLKVGVAAGTAPEVVVSGDVDTNDFEFLGDSFTVTPIVNGTSANGGTVNLNADGTFTYLPAAGFAGASDTFTYTITDDGIAAGTADDLTGTGTVTINFGAQEVWYVDPAFGGTSDGRSTNPFKTLADVSGGTGPDGAGDIIYLNSGTYAGTILLLGTQTLHGENTALLVDVFTLAGVGTAPVIAPGSGTAITLGSGNTLNGFTVGNSGTDIGGTSFGTLTVSNVTLNGTGKVLDLTTGTFATGSAFNSISGTGSATHGMQLVSVGGSVAFGSTTISTSTAQTIFVNNSTADINFGDTIIGTAAAGSGGTEGFRLEANPSGTYTIGNLTIQNTPGRGFQLFGNGAPAAAAANATITGTATISKTVSDAVLVQNTAGNVSFQSLSLDTITGRGIALFNDTGSFTTTGGTIATVSGTDVDITGATNSGTVTIANTITNTVGGLINIDNHETGNVTFSANLSTNTTGIAVNNSNSGTITFSGATKTLGTSTSNAVSLTSNTGGTINFTGGGLDIDTTSGTGFNATGGGTITVTGTGNTIDSVSATALNVANTFIGASGLTFRSISAGAGGGVGISLVNTGANGLTVTGSGTAASGGTIAGKTGVDTSTTSGFAVYLENASNISLARMQMNDHQNHAIRGKSVNNFTLTDSVINGLNGNSITADDDGVGTSGEGAVRFTNLSGSAAVTNCFIGGAHEFIFRVNNNTGTLNRLTISGSTIGDLDGVGAGFGNSAFGDDGLQFEVKGSVNATLNVTLLNNILNQAKGDVIQVAAQQSSTVDFVMRGNSISNSHPSIVSGVGGITIGATSGPGQTSNLTYDISCNKFQDAVGNAMTLFKGVGGTSNMSGTVYNNRIGVTGVVGSGSDSAAGIQVDAQGTGTHTVLIKNNQIRRHNFAGISLQSADGSATLNATVIGNLVAEADAFGFAGLYAESGAIPATDTIKLNLKVGGSGAEQNNFVDGDPGNFSDVLYSKIGGLTQFNFSRGVSGSNDPVVITQANNVAPITVSSAPGMTPVNTVPALPAAIDETCTPPAPLLLGNAGIDDCGCGEPPSAAIDGSVQSARVESMLPPAAHVAPVTNTTEIFAADAALSGLTGSGATDGSMINQRELDTVVAAALARWTATDLTGEQLATLRNLKFEVADLPGLYLGEASGERIRVDNNAGGQGWFVDTTPHSDDEFSTNITGTRRYTDPTSAPAGRIDLLTAVLHEMGHALGLCDNYTADHRDGLMYGYLTMGERRLPQRRDAVAALALGGAHGTELAEHTHFLTLGSISIPIGTLPEGKSVTIVYQVTINPSTPVSQIISQGTVESTTVADKLTDDPDAAGAADPTVTRVQQPPEVSDFSRSVAENSPLPLVADDFTGSFSDPNSDAPADTMQTLHITSLPTNGTLRHNGSTFSASEASPYEISLTTYGTLTYTPIPGYYGPDSFTWNGSDGTAFEPPPVPAATVNITVDPSPYHVWADAKGLTQGVDDGFEDDPDGDGETNIEEYAHDGHPLSAVNDGKRRLAIASGLPSPASSGDHLTYTFPVRGNADFVWDVGSSSLRLPLVDAPQEYVYRVRGSSDLLSPFIESVLETPALAAGLPPLSSTDYSYRTVYFEDALTSPERAFIILDIFEIPPPPP